MTGGNSSTSGEPSSCMKQDRRNSLTEERKAATAWETERRQSGVQKKEDKGVWKGKVYSLVPYMVG